MSVGCSSQEPAPKRQKYDFTLPPCGQDIKKCINKDAFVTSQQRNKLIRESCRALRGYCMNLNRDCSCLDKESLAKDLYSLAPKSLGDPKILSDIPWVNLIIVNHCKFLFRMDCCNRSVSGLKIMATMREELLELQRKGRNVTQVVTQWNMSSVMMIRLLRATSVSCHKKGRKSLLILKPTHKQRCSKMLQLSAAVRITETIKYSPF